LLGRIRVHERQGISTNFKHDGLHFHVTHRA